MTIKELYSELTTLMNLGIDTNTPIVVRDENIDPDFEVDISYYDEETQCVCLGVY